MQFTRTDYNFVHNKSHLCYETCPMLGHLRFLPSIRIKIFHYFALLLHIFRNVFSQSLFKLLFNIFDIHSSTLRENVECIFFHFSSFECHSGEWLYLRLNANVTVPNYISKKCKFSYDSDETFPFVMLLVFVFMVQILVCQYKQTILFESSKLCWKLRKAKQIISLPICIFFLCSLNCIFLRCWNCFLSNFFNALPNEFVDFILKHCYAVKTFSFKWWNYSNW